VFDIHAEHGVDVSFLRYPRDPFPTQLIDFKDTENGKNYTMVAYVSPDFINWTVYRMTYNDKAAYQKRQVVIQHIRKHASVFRLEHVYLPKLEHLTNCSVQGNRI